MTPDRLHSALLPPPPASSWHGHRAANSLLAIERRLARAEEELRIQFIRIAQLQAELDRRVQPYAVHTTAPRALRLTLDAEADHQSVRISRAGRRSAASC